MWLRHFSQETERMLEAASRSNMIKTLEIFARTVRPSVLRNEERKIAALGAGQVKLLDMIEAAPEAPLLKL
jgi:hypothetical protein